jgi:hypothetical protein
LLESPKRCPAEETGRGQAEKRGKGPRKADTKVPGKIGRERVVREREEEEREGKKRTHLQLVRPPGPA